MADPETCETLEAGDSVRLSGTIQLVRWLALTLSLSPGRGDYTSPCWECLPNGPLIPALEKVLPLLGAGVRENVGPQLNRSGKALCGLFNSREIH